MSSETFKIKLDEFVKTRCHACGSQRCWGPGSEESEGCRDLSDFWKKVKESEQKILP